MLALGHNSVLLHRSTEGDVAVAAETLAGVAEEHEVVIAHGFDIRLGYTFGLALRNALPDRDLATMLIDTVVATDDPGRLDGPTVLEPQAIVALRSLRTLIDAGVLVICADGAGIPVTLDGEGTMHGVEVAVDKDLTASLLARRLDADLLVMLTEHGLAPVTRGPKYEAARRFVEATGCRAAIGELREAAEMVRGESGTQISAPNA
jgi:carbamate kinase